MTTIANTSTAFSFVNLGMDEIIYATAVPLLVKHPDTST